nr:hypothetical protein [Noviherbaspirillum aridicola]
MPRLVGVRILENEAVLLERQGLHRCQRLQRRDGQIHIADLIRLDCLDFAAVRPRSLDSNRLQAPVDVAPAQRDDFLRAQPAGERELEVGVYPPVVVPVHV